MLLKRGVVIEKRSALEPGLLLVVSVAPVVRLEFPKRLNNTAKERALLFQFVHVLTLSERLSPRNALVAFAGVGLRPCGGTRALPLTVNVRLVAPPLALVIVPLLLPLVSGAKRTKTGVAATVPDAGVSVSALVNPLLALVEIWKSVGAETVMLLVKFAPAMV